MGCGRSPTAPSPLSSILKPGAYWLDLSGCSIDVKPGVPACVAEAGNVDAAIVYRTDARISPEVRVAYAVPRAQGPDISYPFAVVAEAENSAAARRLLAHLRSKYALDIFARHGFLPR